MNGTTSTLAPGQSMTVASGTEVTVTNPSAQQGSLEVAELSLSANIPIAPGASVTFGITIAGGTIINSGNVSLTVSVQPSPVRK